MRRGQNSSDWRSSRAGSEPDSKLNAVIPVLAALVKLLDPENLS